MKKYLCAVLLLSVTLLCTVHAQTVSQTVPAAFTNFVQSLMNYAAWDDSTNLMYVPTASNVNTYVSLNLAPTVMKNLPINFVGYYFPNGTALIQYGYNYTATAIVPISMPVEFATIPPVIAGSLTNSTMARYTNYITYSNITTMVVGAPIFHSDFTGPVNGFILFGLFQNLLPTQSQYFMDLVINFAVWDTAYNVMTNRSSALLYQFMSSNFAFQSMKNNFLNFAAFFDTSGNPYFTIGYDFTSANPLNQIAMPAQYQNVPQSVTTLLTSDPSARYTTSYPYLNRVVDVVGCPITHTNGAGPIVGFALFGRFENTSQPLTPSSSSAMSVGFVQVLFVTLCLLFAHLY